MPSNQPNSTLNHVWLQNPAIMGFWELLFNLVLLGRTSSLHHSVIQCYSVTVLQCYSVTVLQCYSVTVLQCYSVAVGHPPWQPKSPIQKERCTLWYSALWAQLYLSLSTNPSDKVSTAYCAHPKPSTQNLNIKFFEVQTILQEDSAWNRNSQEKDIRKEIQVRKIR